MPTVDDLQREIAAKDALILQLTLKNLDMRIIALEAADVDQEKRIRTVEVSSTRFETLAWLAFGGGALSAINLFVRFVNP